MEPKDDPTPAEITKEEVDAVVITMLEHALEDLEEESPPPLGINVVETITSKEQLGGD